jgi:hypothetical protein
MAHLHEAKHVARNTLETQRLSNLTRDVADCIIYHILQYQNTTGMSHLRKMNAMLHSSPKVLFNRLANRPTEFFMYRSLESKKTADILKPDQVFGFIYAVKKRNHLVCCTCHHVSCMCHHVCLYVSPCELYVSPHVPVRVTMRACTCHHVCLYVSPRVLYVSPHVPVRVTMRACTCHHVCQLVTI